MKFIIIDLPFKNWVPIFTKNNKCLIIEKKDFKKYDTIKYRFLPINIKNYFEYNSISNNIFPNNTNNIQLLNNKSEFGKYMLNNFTNFTPKIYYYNFDYENYICDINNVELLNETKPNKFIIKPNEDYGGNNVKIIEKIEYMKNSIVQEYIDHDYQYVAHFLVIAGKIIKKIFFCSKHYDYVIKKGPINEYQVLDELTIDDSIYNKIFNDLNYSGFASSDFIIKNDRIIIFEINPRIGGSLVFNEKYFNLFMDILYEYELHNIMC